MKAGKWELELREYEGFNLLLPLSFFTATEREVEEHTGGCGPGGLGDWLVPDTAWGESLFLACQVHDWMYWEGETEEDKAIADRTFLWNMTVVIQDVQHGEGKEDQKLDILRLRRVMTYYQAVSYGGDSAFDKGETPQADNIKDRLGWAEPKAKGRLRRG